MLSVLAQLRAQTLATVHGSLYSGDCDKIMNDLEVAMKAVYDAI